MVVNAFDSSELRKHWGLEKLLTQPCEAPDGRIALTHDGGR